MAKNCHLIVKTNGCDHCEDWVYDPFCGSGTTIIAAEQTGRKCIGIELSPTYCDAICRRFESVTGKKAIRESDGAEFSGLIEARDKANV